MSSGHESGTHWLISRLNMLTGSAIRKTFMCSPRRASKFLTLFVFLGCRKLGRNKVRYTANRGHMEHLPVTSATHNTEHNATQCNTMQHNATQCNTMQSLLRRPESFSVFVSLSAMREILILLPSEPFVAHRYGIAVASLRHRLQICRFGMRTLENSYVLFL